MGLDTSNIRSSSQLNNLIENHLKYQPPNTGYYDTKDDFENRKEKMIHETSHT